VTLSHGPGVITRVSDVGDGERQLMVSDAIVPDRAFQSFVAAEGAQLRRVLYAHFGVELGREATSDALAYAWEHWNRVRTMNNPVGYLYRVAQSSMRRHHRWRRPSPIGRAEVLDAGVPDPGVATALAGLPEAPLPGLFPPPLEIQDDSRETLAGLTVLGLNRLPVGAVEQPVVYTGALGSLPGSLIRPSRMNRSG
jgi:DNA-directed RNA polymerase specialized sigma24 family protein